MMVLSVAEIDREIYACWAFRSLMRHRCYTAAKLLRNFDHEPFCRKDYKGSPPTELNFFLRSGRLLGYVSTLKGPRVLRALPAPQ
jgi:hypothetical protein